MKSKIFTLIVLGLCITATMNAQIKKGSVLLGGSVGFSSSKSEDEYSKNKQHNFNISPAAGKAIKDNLIVGVDVSVGGSKRTVNGFNYRGNSHGVGIFVRKYFEAAKRFYLFGQGRVGTDFYKQEHDYNGGFAKRQGHSINAGFSPGVSYAVSNKVHLESGFTNLFYFRYYNDKDTPMSPIYTNLISKSSGFNVGTFLNNASEITLGVRILLAKG